MTTFRLTSYNIHKGMSPLNRSVIMPRLAQALAKLSSDVLCLQEVSGQNQKRATAHSDYPNISQDEWFGDYLGLSSAYGKNVSYEHGHHGNATLSHFCLDPKHNVNISVSRLEKRGVLHSEILIDGQKVIVLNAHLNLLHHDRKKQYKAIGDYIDSEIDPADRLILAGDFNDYSKKSDDFLGDLGLIEVFKSLYGKHPATFPAKLPILSLDRIYIKNLTAQSACVHRGLPYAELSDHLPITAVLAL